jgi:hypothetical protein
VIGEFGVTGLQSVDRGPDSPRDSRPRPLGCLTTRLPASAAKPVRRAQLVDERVQFESRTLSAVWVIGAVGVVDLGL